MVKRKLYAKRKGRIGIRVSGTCIGEEVSKEKNMGKQSGKTGKGERDGNTESERDIGELFL